MISSEKILRHLLHHLLPVVFRRLMLDTPLMRQYVLLDVNAMNKELVRLVMLLRKECAKNSAKIRSIRFPFFYTAK